MALLKGLCISLLPRSLAAIFPLLFMTKRLIALSSIALLLAACGGTAGIERAAEDAMEAEGAENAQVDFDDGGARIESDEGTVTAGTKAEIPANWPTELGVYPDGELTLAGSSNGQADGENGSMIVFTTVATGAEVSTYYKDALTAAGWTIGQTMQSGTITVLSATKGTQTVGISMSADAGTTSVTIAIQDQQ